MLKPLICASSKDLYYHLIVFKCAPSGPYCTTSHPLAFGKRNQKNLSSWTWTIQGFFAWPIIWLRFRDPIDLSCIKLSFAIANVYLAAVVFAQALSGYLTARDKNSLIPFVLSGWERNRLALYTRRQLMTIRVLRRSKLELRESSYPLCDKMMLWSAFTLAFFGSLRVPEYVSSKQKVGSDTPYLRRRDETVKGSILMLILRSSKCSQTNFVIISSGETYHFCCTVRVFLRYDARRRLILDLESPLFVFLDLFCLARSSVAASNRK